jgi:hypothetical protein
MGSSEKPDACLRRAAKRVNWHSVNFRTGAGRLSQIDEAAALLKQ